MTLPKNRSATFYLLVLGTTANALGVLSFFGIQGNAKARLAVVGTLSILGILASGVTLYNAICIWLSPRGSFYPSSYHRKNLMAGFFSLLAAVILCIFAVLSGRDAITLPSAPEKGGLTTSSPTPSSSPPSTPSTARTEHR